MATTVKLTPSQRLRLEQIRDGNLSRVSAARFAVGDGGFANFGTILRLQVLGLVRIPAFKPGVLQRPTLTAKGLKVLA